jgi:adenosylmethionine-8-amino-7-oxononanoate transaminase/dethiobiotin synthase
MKAFRCFVVGTDTGVGKTVVTGALARLLQERGLDVGVMKPVETGCEVRDGWLVPEDASWLAGLVYPEPDVLLDRVCPVRYGLPAAPAVAARHEGHVLDWPAIHAAADTLSRDVQVLLLEGAGGALVPLDDHHTILDAAARLGASVLVVGRAGLGGINHAALTIRAVQDAGLPCLGFVLSDPPGEADRPALAENSAWIARLTGAPYLGTVPPVHDRSPAALVSTCRDALAPVLEALVSRLDPGDRERRARRLEEADKRLLWHPFTQMADFVREDQVLVEHATGAELVDTLGRVYLDANSSLWVNLHGHRHPRLMAALREQLGRLDHSTMLGLGNVPAVELAERLVAIAPPGLTRVFYSDNGSTAVEAALKMAFQHWHQVGKPERRKFAALEGAYHGDTLGAVSVGGISMFHGVYAPMLFEVVRVPFPDGEGWETDLERCFAEHGPELAAFVTEPLIQGASGMRLLPPGHLRRVRELCDRYDVLLVVDEVATGFGRTGRMFACEHEGVAPDLMAVAKGLTGGTLPLAATLATERVYAGFLGEYARLRTFFHGHSYTGNPLACAAAIASLDLFREEDTLARIADLAAGLEVARVRAARSPHVGATRQLGAIAALDLVRPGGEPYRWEEKVGIRVCQAARDHGVLVRPIGNTLVVMPPYAVTPPQLERLFQGLERAIERVCGGA